MPLRAADSPSRPVHTPYADGVTPFAVGVSPVAPEDWIEPEPGFARALGEKARLMAAAPDVVFAEEPGSRAAQAEVLARLSAFLPARFPALYRLENGSARLHDAPAVDGRAPAPGDDPPLVEAARLVPEDLLLMGPPRAPGESWRLIAGSVCFPSSWSLGEKIGRPLDLIHENVPGFEPGTRNAAVIDRIFERLRPEQLVGRHNWSIYGSDRLDQPVSKHAAPDVFARSKVAETPHVRIERQTLLKLPGSGAILFTVRIHVDSLETLAAHPDAARLARGLADRLGALDAAQLAYKSLGPVRDTLLARLAAIAGEP